MLNNSWQTAQREHAKDLKAGVGQGSTRLCARQGSTLNGSLLDIRTVFVLSDPRDKQFPKECSLLGIELKDVQLFLKLALDIHTLI